jgi:hypothetical protein
MAIMASMFTPRAAGVAALWRVAGEVLAMAAALAALLCAAQPAAAQFIQQGPKLLGSGEIYGGHGASQGWSVALSADGNAGTGDFNGDGKSDIIWRDNVGDISIWLMNGATISSGVGLGQLPIDWQIVETGDFNGDRTSDVLWFSSTFGVVAMWLMNGGQIMQSSGVGFMGGGWTIQNINVD